MERDLAGRARRKRWLPLPFGTCLPSDTGLGAQLAARRRLELTRTETAGTSVLADEDGGRERERPTAPGPNLPPEATMETVQHPPVQRRTATALPPSVSRTKTNPAPRGRWSELFTRNRVCAEDTTLTLIRSPGHQVTLISTDMESMDGKFGHCLVGRFLERFPGWKAVKTLTEQWSTPHQMLTHDSAWLVFKFSEKQM